MTKLNCWEFMKCGRQLGGENVDEMGACPAATEIRVDGIHEGQNGGRVCWFIAGTLCEGEIQGTHVEKFQKCIFCDFYKKVMEEEGLNAANSFKVLSLLKS